MGKWNLALVILLLGSAVASAQGWAEKMFGGKIKHDFGTVPRGAQLTHSFTITNIYAVPMQITEVKSGCGCATATAKKSVLASRESTTIDVRMDGRRFAGPKTVVIRVTVGPEYISTAELRVSANSRSDVVFNPGEVNFGTVALGQTPTQNIDVEYAGALDWRVNEVVANGLPFDVAIKELYRRPGQVGYRLAVTLKADAPVGALKQQIHLKTNDPASPVVPVLVEATVQSALRVSPSTLRLGTVQINTPLTRRVVVRGNNPFKLTAVEAQEGIELGAPLATTESPVHFVTLKCTFSAPGPFRRELRIRTSAQSDPVQVVVEGIAVK